MLSTTSQPFLVSTGNTSSKRHPGCPLPVRNSKVCLAKAQTSLQDQRLIVTRKLADVLAHRPQPGQDAPTATFMHVSRLVEEYVLVLLKSEDWLQLKHALDHAQQQYNIAAAVMKDAIPPDEASADMLLTVTNDQSRVDLRQDAQRDATYPAKSTELPATQQQQEPSNAGSIRLRSQHERGTGTLQVSSSSSSSPWGFALRQPRSKSSASTAAAASAIAGTPCNHAWQSSQAAQQQRRQQQQLTGTVQWRWSSVQQLLVLGLGSMGHFDGNSSSSVKASSRMTFRFFQLVLATALHRHMLPGLDSSPIAYDPEFDQFDRCLLTSLGFRVLSEEPSYLVTRPTLLYMPCCPRQLYSQVLGHNWSSHHLQHLAIVGTSMGSLAATQALYLSLTSQPPADKLSSSSSSSIQQRKTPGSGVAAADNRDEQAESRSGADETDHVQLAYQKGRVIEVPVPDCAAHGVGVAVHLFRPQT